MTVAILYKTFDPMPLSDTLLLGNFIDIQMQTNYHSLFNEYNFALDPDHLILLIYFKYLLFTRFKPQPNS